MPRTPTPPTRTAVDAMLDDPRLQAVMDTWATRLRAGKPVRWHRLLHLRLGQLHAGPDLALIVEMKWRLARGGIATTLESVWLPTT